MKKLLGILALAICLILCACGSENAAETVPSAAEEVTAATEVTSAETEATENEGLDAGYYYGTWKVVGIERNGQRFSVEGLEKDGNYLVSNMTLILRDDGKYYFYVGLNTDTAEWVVSETGIVVDGDVMVLEGDTLSLDFTSFIAYFERSSTDTAFPEEKWYTEKDVYGTWKLCGVYTVSDSQYYTLAEVRKANEKLAESYFVFAQDGKGFVRIEDSEQHITWTYEDKTIIIGNAKIGCAYDLLFMTDDTYIYLFIKDSDDCTIPEKQDDIRPEFKEAMDSYEEFFKEYCEFMKKMKENPNDISLLLSYTQYMTQYAEMMQKMEAMDDGTLNDAELQYYLEVTGRITQMLYEAAL